MLKLTINGKEVAAKQGDTILEVCQRENIYVPTLCYQKELIPYGGCRMCLVEVEGIPRPATACTLPAAEGVVIKTDTPRLKKLRAFTLQLILSEHPQACLICGKKEDCAKYQECIEKSPITSGCKFCAQNGNCELQKLVEYLEIKEIPFEFSYRNLPIERDDPFFDRDYNLCILCGRCLRVCQDIRNANVLDFHHRGPLTLVGTAFSQTHIEAHCQFCGACVDACPTGALRQRYGKWEDQVQKSVKSTCLLCSLGCPINFNINSDQIVSSTPDNDQICVRGRFGIAPLVHHPKRMTHPLLKKEGRIVEVGWEEALKYLALKLNEHKGRTGIIFSPQLSIETIDLLYSLAENLKCKISAPLAVENNLRPLNLKEFKNDSIFIILNTDLVSDFSPLLLKLRRQMPDAKFIVIDVLDSMMAQIADLWLRPKLGCESDLLRILFSQTKVANRTGIAGCDIEFAKNLLANKSVYLLYNPKNISNLELPDAVQSIPLSSQVNTLKILEQGLTCSIEDLLNNKSIDCLYLVGIAAKLSREYKTIIVQDFFSGVRDFDLFLPAATFAEVDGSVIDIEGNIKKLRKALEPTGEAMSDDWIINEIGKVLKCALNNKPKSLRSSSVQTLKHNKLSKAYPYNLIVREDCYGYRGLPLAKLIKGFARLRQDHCIWINPDIAEELQIKNGAQVRVVGRTLDMQMVAKISEVLPEKSIFVYHHPIMGVIEDHAVRLECV